MAAMAAGRVVTEVGRRPGSCTGCFARRMPSTRHRGGGRLMAVLAVYTVLTVATVYVGAAWPGPGPSRRHRPLERPPR